MSSSVSSVAATYAARNVLVTGHTGFKGSWLSLWLASWGARVTGYALEPTGRGESSNFADAEIAAVLAGHHLGDVRDRDYLTRVVRDTAPEVIFHLAGQPLVLEGYAQPDETFEVNVMGTVHLLDAIRAAGRPCAVVVVTSDKCYQGPCPARGYREDDPLGGHDPYSASKAAAEIATASYRRSFFSPDRLDEHGVQVATVRAGNVIGGGDWAAYRIVPDIVAALVADEPVVLRQPGAIRPWQHVLDPLFGYAALGAAMIRQPDPHWCEAFNFGPGPGAEIAVHELVDDFIDVWGGGSWTSTAQAGPYESPTLRLDVSKARRVLGYEPTFDGPTAIRRTAAWYRHQLTRPRGGRERCLEDIVAFESLHRRRAPTSLPAQRFSHV